MQHGDEAYWSHYMKEGLFGLSIYTYSASLNATGHQCFHIYHPPSVSFVKKCEAKSDETIFLHFSNLTILHFHNGAVGMHLGALCLTSLTGILHQIIIFLSSPFTCTCKIDFQGNQIFILFFTLIHTLKRQCKLQQKNWCKEENLKGEKGDFIYVPSKRAGNISSIHWKGN